ncbi:extracellular solute-binding protein [Anaerocolumna sp.]|uniref:extracellular solute-binding protein n=1 Tax=Anaerocolumna sp. TaxID=2041569 RepID=UPI0028B0397A|nr:extracellular solute-binding protein [Anaerocolumna sp.]
MKKKLLALVLSTVMIAGSLAGCGKSKPAVTETPKPADSGTTDTQKPADKDIAGESSKSVEELLLEPYAEPVDIHVVLQYKDSEDPDTPEGVTPEKSTAVKLLKEELNINLIYDWVVNADQFKEKFGAELAAGNLPDIFLLEDPNDFEDLASQGGLADLTEYYEKYRNDDLDSIFNYDGKFINVGKRDGKLYGLPMGTDPAQMTSQMIYNMTQLESVGITSVDQLPKTIEEFEALCDKLMKVDYDGDGKTGGPVIPACKNYMDAQLADFQPFFHAYETWADGWYDKDGTLQYAGIDEGIKTTLEKLNQWYNKGYFQKDFAAYDIWAADSPIVNDIVAGKYAIVPASWWVPNWPLNTNKVEHPESNWVIGPNLSPDGNQPTIMIDRYPVNKFVVVGRNCKNPEAIFKMMYWSLQDTLKKSTPEYQRAMTEEQKIEWHSNVYTWLPYRIFSPTSLRTNFETINKLVSEGKTEITEAEAARNNEFWGAWDRYLKYKENPNDGVAWGVYFSRLAPDGGVANMIKTVETADIIYDEVYITTPSMVSRKAELDKLRNNTFLSMVMGETPISDFDKFVEQWKAQGGDEIAKEVNEWYQSNK